MDRLDKVILTPLGATDTVAPLPKKVQKHCAKQVAVNTCDVDPQYVDADPDRPFHFDAGPEPITFHFDADPDQDPTLYSKVSEF